MSLQHALLTALIQKPSFGIELSTRFDRSIGYYWHATHQQIYRELARMEASGWIEATPIESSRGNKKLYHILPAGRNELQRWISESRDPDPERNELLIRLRAEAVLGSNCMLKEIERLLQVHKERLAIFLALEKQRFSEPNPTRATAILHLTLKKGIMHETVCMDWLKEVLQVLNKQYPED